MRLLPLLVFFGFLSSLGPGPGAQGPRGPSSPPVLFWEPSLDSALRRAGRIHRPVLVVLFREKGRNSLSPLGKTFLSPWVFRYLRELVLLPACPDAHEGALPEGWGEACPLCRTITCAQHKAAYIRVLEKFPELGKEPETPQLLFLSPKGDLISRRIYPPTPEEFLTLAREALEKVAPRCLSRVPGLKLPDSLSKGKGKGKEKEPRKFPKAQGAGAEIPWSGLFSEDRDVRLDTMGELLEQKDLSLMENLFAQLPKSWSKVEMLRLMARPGEDRFLPFLCRVLEKEKDPLLKVHAAVTLEVIGKRDEKAQALVAKALARERDPRRQGELALALGRVAVGAKNVFPRLARLSRSNQSDARMAAFLAMGELPKGTLPLFTLLRKGAKGFREDVKGAALWSLVKLGAPRVRKDLADVRRRPHGHWTRVFLDLFRKALDGSGEARAEALGEVRKRLLWTWIPRDPKGTLFWLKKRGK